MLSSDLAGELDKEMEDTGRLPGIGGGMSEGADSRALGGRVALRIGRGGGGGVPAGGGCDVISCKEAWRDIAGLGMGEARGAGLLERSGSGGLGEGERLCTTAISGVIEYGEGVRDMVGALCISGDSGMSIVPPVDIRTIVGGRRAGPASSGS